jgi:hypothetical protein
MNENLARVMSYVGYGDDDPALWFMGIEEHDAWRSPQHIDDVLQPASTHRVNGIVYTYGDKAAYVPQDLSGRWEAKIALPLSESGDSGSNSDRYISTKLCLPGSKTFHCNVWPLGRQNEGVWPENYPRDFDLTLEQWRQRRRELCEGRFQSIIGHRSATNVKATVCFGTDSIDAFEDCLGLCRQNRPAFHKRLYVWEKERVILAHHWGHGHLRDDDVSSIVAILKDKWLLSLP